MALALACQKSRAASQVKPLKTDQDGAPERRLREAPASSTSRGETA
jgi:hypothetical protein